MGGVNDVDVEKNNVREDACEILRREDSIVASSLKMFKACKEYIYCVIFIACMAATQFNWQSKPDLSRIRETLCQFCEDKKDDTPLPLENQKEM